MKTITIYGKSYCPFCDAAKKLCETMGAKYNYIDASPDTPAADELHRLAEQHGHFTVPLILIEDTFVGGFTDLQQLQQSGKLEELLG